MRVIFAGSRVRPPAVEHGQKRLAAGKDAGLIAMLGQDRDRLFDRIRTHIVERTRLHRMPPLPAIARSWGRLASGPAISA